jgi:tripartite-type tricarboxylate transporter receptor subunit TctC
MRRRKFLDVLGGLVTWSPVALALLAASTTALGQTFPIRPITMVVPFPAGGPTDTVARILAEGMRTALGQPIIIENVSGAGGSLGVRRVVRSVADGYTLSIGQLSSHVFGGAIYPGQYDLLTDLEPIALLTTNPLMFAGRKGLPATDMRELIAWLRQNPDKVSYGIIGNGSPTHLWGLYFQNKTGTQFPFVPYRGAAPAVHDMLAGQLDLVALQASDLLPQVRAGNLNAYAILDKIHWATAPDIPTVDEAGVPGLYVPFWHGLWAVKNTTKEVISKLNSAVVEALADPTVQNRLAGIGQEIFPRQQQTPEALAVFQKTEIEKWWPIIKAAGIKAE